MSSMPQLRSLNVSNNQLDTTALDTAELTLLTQLRTLKMDNNLALAMPDLSGLSHLEFVSANGNEIDDLSGLLANDFILHERDDHVDIRMNRLADQCDQLAPLIARAFEEKPEVDLGSPCPVFKFRHQKGDEFGASVMVSCRVPGSLADPALLLSLMGLDENGDMFLCWAEVQDPEAVVEPDARFGKVSDLWGLENFGRLQAVVLRHHHVSSLAPLLANENFMASHHILIMPGNLLGEDYPNRCKIEGAGFTSLNLDDQQNEVVWTEDPCP